MVFSDPVFLFFFLPCCLTLLWLGAWRIRNVFLTLIGGLFYVWGAGAFIWLLAGSIVVNHVAASHLARLRTENRVLGRRVVGAVVAANVASLALWKYGGFAVSQVSAIMRSVGFESGPTLQLALPIAISFYTFQCISYVVDVWRGTAEPAPRLIDFSAYILLFPHLIAGPIVRYADIESDLLSVSRRRFDDFCAGAPRFFWGLGKKVLIADQVAAIANVAFSLPDNRVNTAVAWVGVLAYAVQIYFDFSGYSDMAIGLARMLGFHFPENFDRPYSALSITDFWRRWHISLSSWFRDYVYIPLGGNRRGPARTYVNLSIVFLLTGVWHGANWTFVVWGIFHGTFMVVERLSGLGVTSADRFVAVRRAATFAIVCVGWAIFRADDIGQAAHFVRSMLTPSGLGLPVLLDEVLTRQRVVWSLIGLGVVFLPARAHFGRQISSDSSTVAEVVRVGVVLVIAPLACAYALSSTFSPFLYFQF